MKVLCIDQARVTGGRANGHGRTPDGEIDVDLRLPKELGGAGGGANPEQLFAVGYAGCFETVLSMVGQREKLDADGERAARLVSEAHQWCPYSSATRGNIDVALVVNGVPLAD